MTNFYYILNLDYPAFHNGDNEAKDKLITKHLANVENQVLALIKNSSDLDVKMTDELLKIERTDINKRLENGSRLYYVWLRHLSRLVGRDFLKDEKSRDAFQKLSENNNDKENDKTVYEEKYIANLVKEFNLLLGNDNFADMPESEIIRPYMDEFFELMRKAGKSDKDIDELRKYILDRLEAEIDINSHPELRRGFVKTDADSKKEKHSESKEKEIRILPDKKRKSAVILEGKITIPSFMKSAAGTKHKVQINGKEYIYRESDFPSKVTRNPNRLCFEILYNALKTYQKEVNETKLVETPTKLLDKIAYRFKQFIASLTKTDYIITFDNRQFMFDSNELHKYRSNHGLIADMANLAYGKYRNEISYPDIPYKTEDDFKRLLKGEVVQISKDIKDSKEAEYSLVFDHDLREEELTSEANRNFGYTRVSYELFQKNQAKSQKKSNAQPQHTTEKAVVGLENRSNNIQKLRRESSSLNGQDDDFGDDEWIK